MGIFNPQVQRVGCQRVVFRFYAWTEDGLRDTVLTVNKGINIDNTLSNLISKYSFLFVKELNLGFFIKQHIGNINTNRSRNASPRNKSWPCSTCVHSLLLCPPPPTPTLIRNKCWHWWRGIPPLYSQVQSLSLRWFRSQLVESSWITLAERSKSSSSFTGSWILPLQTLLQKKI